MALPKQVVEVHFDKGLNTKLNPKLLPPGQLVTLDDCCFDDSNTIKKRDGYTLGTTSMSNGSTLSAAFMGFTLGNALAQIDTVGITCVYSEAMGKWARADAISLTRIDRTQIIRNSATQTAPDVAAVGATELWAWEDSRGGVRASSIDKTTGATIMYDTVIDASATRPRCLAFVVDLYIFYLSGANVKVAKLDQATRGFITSTTTLKTDASAVTPLLDVAYNTTNGKIYIAYQNNGGANQISTFTWDGVTASGTVTVNPAATIDALHINCYSGGSVAVMWSVIAGPTLKFASSAASPLSFGAAVQITNVHLSVEHITSAQTGANLLVVYGRNDNTDSYLATATISTAAVTVAAAKLSQDIGPASKPFTINGKLAVAAIHKSDLQPTAFIIGVQGSYAGDVLARSMYSRCGSPYATGTSMPSPVSIDSTNIAVPAVERGRIQFSNGQDKTPVGISRLVISAQNQTDRNSAELNGITLLPGGNPMLFDGTGFVEAGFHRFPFNLQATAAGAGHVLSNGTYQYVAVEEWVDAKGNLHRGIPSVPVSVVAVAGNNCNVTVNGVAQTRRSANLPDSSNDSFIARTNSKIVLYRTTANGTVFYKLTQILGSNADNVTTPAGVLITITDQTTSDTDIQANEVLYTQGGALENEPPPACRYVCVHQKRWVVAGIEGDAYGFAYSQEAELGEIPGFSEVLYGRVPPDLGKITGVASMDDRLFLFCERGIWAVSGVGPDSTGGQNGYSEPQKVSADTGCSASRSIIETPDGLMFLSPRGIRLLSRTLSVVPIGLPVDSLATACIAALVDQTKNQARFYTGTSVLVWDFLWQQWSKYTNHSAVGAVNYNGLPCHLTSSGALATPGGTTDNGSAIPCTVETGWLNFGAVQAIQRVWRALILGKCTAAQTINLMVGYDYEDTYTDSVSINEAATTPVAATVDSSTVRMFRCDESSGDLVDAIGGPSITQQGSVTSTTGVITNARRFNSNAYFSNSGAPYANDYTAMSGTQRTLEAWVYPDSTIWNNTSPFSRVVVALSKASPDHFTGLLMYLEIWRSARTCRFLYEIGVPGGGTNSANIQVFDSTEVVPLDQWTHIAVVLDGANGIGQYYFNGVAGTRSSGLALPTAGLTNVSMFVGSNPDTVDQFWRGNLDDIRISNVARTAAEIRTTYQNGAGAIEHAMQFRHHLTRQKCEALRLKLTSSSATGTVGFASMAFEVGGKKGGYKLPGAGTI